VINGSSDGDGFAYVYIYIYIYIYVQLTMLGEDGGGDECGGGGRWKCGWLMAVVMAMD
jgi:hypothetical protein